MAYTTPDNRRQSSSRRHQGRAGDSRASSTGSISSSGTRRVQARGGSSAQYRNRNRRSRGKGGYSLGSRGRRGGLINQAMNDPRLLAVLIVGTLLVLALLVGLFSLIRGCVNSRAQKKQEAAADTDTRVSLSISSSMAEEFTARLDRNERLAQIAQNADVVGDERILQLALDEPDAIEFVYGYLSSDTPKSAQPFTDGVSKGYYPTLYTWDSRWGYVTYGDGPMAITGSGPTALAMAYMGLLGKTDQTPSTIADLAVQRGKTDKVYGTSADFFIEEANGLGLDIEEYSANGETLSELLESGTVVLVQLRERSITDNAHWALAVSKNLDGSINLYDPTSTEATKHPWDPASIASGADAFYSLSAAPVEETGEEG